MHTLSRTLRQRSAHKPNRSSLAPAASNQQMISAETEVTTADPVVVISISPLPDWGPPQLRRDESRLGCVERKLQWPAKSGPQPRRCFAQKRIIHSALDRREKINCIDWLAGWNCCLSTMPAWLLSTGIVILGTRLVLAKCQVYAARASPASGQPVASYECGGGY